MSELKTSTSSEILQQVNTIELAQELAHRLGISPSQWHQLKANRKAQAGQQAAAALVFLLKDRPEEALMHLDRAAKWLDRSISALPCPTHGNTDRS